MENYKYKETIYILVYNNIDSLQKTVGSVLELNNPDAQIVLSDDGSTKFDTSLLEDYAKQLRTKYKSVIVNINEKNVGTVKHINKVLSLCEGRYLFPLSSGDTFNGPDAINRVIKVFEKKKCLIVAARHKDVYEDGHSKIRPSFYVGYLLKWNPKYLMNYMVRKRNLISGCSIAYDRALIEKYGKYDEKYHLVEDYPYYINLLRKNVKFGWCRKPSVIHEIGGVSTGKIHPSIYKDIELMREELYGSLSEFDKKTQQFLTKCHEEYIKQV